MFADNAWDDSDFTRKEVRSVLLLSEKDAVNIDCLCASKQFGEKFCYVLTIILRNRAEYRLILSRRGRRPRRLKSGDIPQD